MLALADLAPRFLGSDIDALLAFLRSIAVALATMLERPAYAREPETPTT